MAKEQKKQQDLVRIMGTDINAKYTLLFGFSRIKGVGIMFSNALCYALKFDKTRKISSLSEEEIEKVEEFLSNPSKAGIPVWMLNQRKEYESGLNLHFIAKDIDFNELQATRRNSKLKTYKSQRRKVGLPVRGQRTRSNFRKNKTIAAMKAKSGGKK